MAVTAITIATTIGGVECVRFIENAANWKSKVIISKIGDGQIEKFEVCNEDRERE